MPDDKLPSINDWDDSKELPSVEDFLKEEVVEELPSVEDYIEEEEVKEEDTVTIEDANGDPFLEVTDVVKAPEWSELIRMVNDVRESIPDIPEVRYYDDELKQLAEHIEQVRDNIPEVKDYDPTVEAITEQIDLLRTSVKDLPEVKYYDEQIDTIEDKIDLIQQEVTNLPEPKYYDEDLQSIKEEVEKVRSEIPVFPQWVNEVNEVPDFSWIGKTFGVIDDDFIKVGDNLKSLRDRIDLEVNELSESLETKDFEKKVEINEVKENLKETKDKIYKELKDCAIRIWDHHTQFQDDDRKLKKQVLSKLNETKQNIEKQIKESYSKSYESNKTLKAYFDGLKEEIANLPKVKYYDDSIENVSQDVSQLSSKIDDTTLNISELYKIVNNIKSEQEELLEIYNDRPVTPDPASKEGDDPLTPTDQKFATLKDLAANYRLFVNRVEQQLYTIGGGGAGFIKDLSDVNLDGLEDGNTLVWNATTSKWDAGAGTGVGGTWASDAVGVYTGRNVGIATTARSEYNLYVGSGTTTDTVAYFDGHISVAGSIFSREVVEIDSIGIVTAGKGVRVTTGGLVVTAGVATVGTAITMGGGTVTATNFIGSGSGLTGVASTDYIITGTAATFNNQVQVGTALTIGYAGVATFIGASGIGVTITPSTGKVEATYLVGDGSSITNIGTEIEETTTTSSGITTTFSVTGGYTVGYVEVYLNGVKQRGSGVDFTASDGSNVVLSTPAQDGDVLEFVNYKAIVIHTGITTASGLTTTASVNTSGIITAATFSGDGSGLTGVASTDYIITGTAATFNNKVFVGTAITMEPGTGGGINVTGVVTATSFNGTLATTNLSGTITNAQLAGSIANGKLSNSSVSYGGVELSLGETDATPAFDLTDATKYPYTKLIGVTTEISADTTPQLGGSLDANSKDISGIVNLQTTGITTVGDLVKVGSAVTFDGAAAGGGINVTGVVTATSFSGDGSSLSGITAGVGIKTSGGVVGYGVTFVDFRGAGISTITAPSSGISTVNITGGGGGGGTPGGSDTQIQYNNSSSFGGVSNLTFSGSVLTFSGMNKEEINIVANKLSAATDINLADGHVHMFTTNESADATPNLRYDGSTTLASKMAVGDVVTLTIIAAVNSQQYTYDSFNIDGSGITELWLGGNVPQGGGAGYDVYTYTIIKTAADPVYSVLINVVNFQS